MLYVSPELEGSGRMSPFGARAAPRSGSGPLVSEEEDTGSVDMVAAQCIG